MAKRGQSFTEKEVQRIVSLLSDTDMTIYEIAQRMACSHSAIVAVNRRFQVRKYAGLKSAWTVKSLEHADV